MQQVRILHNKGVCLRKKIVKLSNFKHKTYGSRAILKRVAKRKKNQSDVQDILSNFSITFKQIESEK